MKQQNGSAKVRISIRQSLILPTLLFGPFLSLLDGGIVNIGLPSMATEWNASLGQVQWVSSVYLLVISILLPLVGALSDRIGRKRVYSSGYFVLAVFTLVCGLAPSLKLLVVARVLQAVGASMIIANGMALVTENFSPETRAHNLGILATSAALGSIAGPVLGGMIIGYWGWRMVFPVTAAVAFAGALFASLILPRDAGTPAGNPPRGAATWVKDLLGVPLFLVSEFRSSWGVALVGFTAIMAPTVLMPFYFQSVVGLVPQTAGLAMMVFPAMMLVVSPWNGWMAKKFGSKKSASAGLLMAGTGLSGLAVVGSHTPLPVVLILYSLLGAALGMFQSSNNSIMMGAAPKTNLGSAAAYAQLARNLGTALAIGLSGWAFSFFQDQQKHLGPQSFADSMSPVYWSVAFLTLVALAGQYLVPKKVLLDCEDC